MTTWNLTLRTITGDHTHTLSGVADTPADALRELIAATGHAAAAADGYAGFIVVYLDGDCIGGMSPGADTAARRRLDQMEHSGLGWIARRTRAGSALN